MIREQPSAEIIVRARCEHQLLWLDASGPGERAHVAECSKSRPKRDCSQPFGGGFHTSQPEWMVSRRGLRVVVFLSMCEPFGLEKMSANQVASAGQRERLLARSRPVLCSPMVSADDTLELFYCVVVCNLLPADSGRRRRRCI